MNVGQRADWRVSSIMLGRCEWGNLCGSRILLYIFWSRLRCSPSAMSDGFGTGSPPLLKLAEILSFATSLIFWIFSPSCCLVHMKSSISWCRAFIDSSWAGSAINMWLYSGRTKYSTRTKYSARPNRRQYQSKKLNFRKTFFYKR